MTQYEAHLPTSAGLRRRAGLVIVTLVGLAGACAPLVATAAHAATPEPFGLAGDAVITRFAAGSVDPADLVLRDPHGDERILTDGTARYRRPAFSPDGTRLAYVRQPAGGGPGDIWVMNADGTEPTRITSDPADDDYPDWSPDGSRLAFASNRSGHYQVYSVPVSPTGDPGVAVQLTPAGVMGANTESSDPAWSPDGQYLAVVHRNVGDPAQIWRITADGSAAEPLTNTTGDHREPAYSPDGSLIAFSSNRNAVGTNNYDVFVRSADPAAPDTATAITTGPDYEGVPHWLPRPDATAAQQLVYSRTLTQTDDEVRIVNADGSNDHVYVSSTGDDVGAVFQPLPGCTVLWDGGAGTDSWSDPANWSGDAVPTGRDHVCIPQLAAPVTVQVFSAAQAASIVSSEDLAVSNVLDAGSGVTLRDGATLTLAAGSTLDGSGTLAGGEFVWGLNARLGDPTSADTGTWTLAPDATLSLPAGQRELYGNRVIRNQGTIALAENASLDKNYFYSQNPRLVNDGGTILKTGTGTASLPIPFDNDGTVQVTGGTLSIGNTPGSAPIPGVTDMTSSGTFDVAADAELDIVNDLTLGDPQHAFTGDGTFRLSFGSLDVGSEGLHSPGTFHLDGGTLVGSGPLTGGEFVWGLGARLGGPTSADTGTWTIGPDATLTVPAGQHQLYGNRIVDNQGTITLAENASLDKNSYYAQDPRLVNDGGTILKTDTGAATITIPFTNNGTVSAGDGTIAVPTIAGPDLTGGYTAGDGGRIQFDGTPSFSTITGSVELTGSGALTTSGGASVLDHVARNDGSLTLRGAASLTVPGAFVNTGTVTLRDTAALTAGSYAQSTGTTDVHDAGAVLDSGSGAAIAGGRLKGAGTVRGPLTNSGGVIDPAGEGIGELTVAGAYTQGDGGTLHVDIAGAQPGEHDRLSVTGGADVDGTIDVAWDPDYEPAPADCLGVIGATPLQLTASVHSADDAYSLVAAPTADCQLTTADLTPPTGLVVSPVTPTGTTWLRQKTVALTVSGAIDANGVARYEVRWSNGSTVAATQDGAGPTFTSPPLSSGEYSASVVAVDPAGNRSAPVRSGPWRLDTTAPRTTTLTSPNTAITLTTASTAPTISVSWTTATDLHSGLSGYRLQSQLLKPGSRTWTTWTTGATSTALTSRIHAVAGANYCFRIVTVDRAGNTATGAARCTSVPTDNRALTASRSTSGTWRTVVDRRAYLGTVSYARARGATLTLRNVSARRIAVVFARRSTSGRILIYWNGKPIGTVDTAGGAANRVIAVLPSFRALQTGTLILKTADGKGIYIDAVAGIA